MDVKKIFGKTIAHNNKHYIVDLHDYITTVSKFQLNKHFKPWSKTIKHWQKRRDVALRRL
ncbi:MAG: hypothetical protein ACR2LL_09880 [Nitrosopumilus sp.]